MTELHPLGRDQTTLRQDQLLPFPQTPWQTVGPFFHYSLPWKGGADLVGRSDLGARTDLIPAEHDLLRPASQKPEVAGERIDLSGGVFDAEGKPMPDALVEIWQANSVGHYSQATGAAGAEDFIGFGRSSTQDDGGYRFLTIKPGRAAGPCASLQAPHIAVSIFGRGVLKRLVTRVYFEDETSNQKDVIFNLAPLSRQKTLLARKTAPLTYRFDIFVGGPQETVFFDF